MLKNIFELADLIIEILTLEGIFGVWVSTDELDFRVEKKKSLMMMMMFRDVFIIFYFISRLLFN